MDDIGVQRCCKNCHFLGAPVNTRTGSAQQWTDEQRETANPRVREYAGCYKGIWRQDWLPEDEEGNVSIESFRETILEDREDSCFFIEYRAGMTWEVADELQRLQYHDRHLQRGYRNTQNSLRISARGVRISGFALAVTAVFSALNFVISLLSYLRGQQAEGNHNFIDLFLTPPPIP